MDKASFFIGVLFGFVLGTAIVARMSANYIVEVPEIDRCIEFGSRAKYVSDVEIKCANGLRFER